MLRIIVFLMILISLSGCAWFSGGSAENTTERSPMPEEQHALITVPYHAQALNNFYMGRDYAAQGRYELAREYYLLALASARNDQLRQSLVYELNAVDRLIKTLR